MSIETKTLTAQIPLALAARIDAVANRLDRSREWVIKQALADWVDSEEERHRRTLEALADVDAGRLIADSAIHAWADSLATSAPLPPPGG